MTARNRTTEVYRTDWNGILIEITYKSQWLPPHILGEDLAHLEIRSIYTTNTPLPVTETGYLSQFIAASVIAAAGGAVAFVDTMLEAESKRPEWLSKEKERQQLTLF